MHLLQGHLLLRCDSWSSSASLRTEGVHVRTILREGLELQLAIISGHGDREAQVRTLLREILQDLELSTRQR